MDEIVREEMKDRMGKEVEGRKRVIFPRVTFYHGITRVHAQNLAWEMFTGVENIASVINTYMHRDGM